MKNKRSDIFTKQQSAGCVLQESNLFAGILISQLDRYR